MRLGPAALTALTLAAGTVAAQYTPDPARGQQYFRTYCVACHGAAAAGCGTRARLYSPRPANLTQSRRSPEYKAQIIRNGGQAMGRSPYMPPWVGQIGDDRIRDIVEYLGMLDPIETPTC